MGFSTVGSFVVMFFAILIMISSVFMIYSNVIGGTAAINEQQEQRAKRLATSINILNVSVTESLEDDKTTINILNDGQRNFDPQEIDVYLDGEYIARESENLSKGFKSDNSVNPMHFDPGEIYQVNITKDIDNSTHQIVVTAEFGITDSTTFSK